MIDNKKKQTQKNKKITIKPSQPVQNTKKTYKAFISNLEHNIKQENFVNNNNNSNSNNNVVYQSSTKTIQKLQEELNLYKTKSLKNEEEILALNKKIKEITEKNNTKKEEEKNSDKDNNSISSNKANKLKKLIKSIFDVFLDVIELILSQKINKENYQTQKGSESISIDIYENSAYNDEDKRSLIFEQIQQILIFKLNYIKKLYNLQLDKHCERIRNWNLLTMNNKENNKDISFSSFSGLSINNIKRNSTSMTGSDIGISTPHSPKFPERKDSSSLISNIIGLGGDSFSLEGENLSKYKEDLDNKEQSKGKEVDLINTSFKDLSLIRSGDEQSLGKISFTKNLDKFSSNNNIDNEINEEANKEIIIKNDNQLNISFNEI